MSVGKDPIKKCLKCGVEMIKNNKKGIWRCGACGSKLLINPVFKR